jgi:hypothetical protein
MKMRVAQFVLAAGLALIAGTAAAQDVTYDYDKGADFSRLSTYAWVPGHGLKDELNHKRVVAAIDAQLTSKGLTRVEPTAHPDVLVAYHASFDKDLRITGFSSGWGGYRFGGTRSGSATTDTILNGTLVLDIVDAQTRSIVWRGVASKELDVKADPEKRDKNIKKATEKLLKSYPPAARG